MRPGTAAIFAVFSDGTNTSGEATVVGETVQEGRSDGVERLRMSDVQRGRVYSRVHMLSLSQN